MVKLYYIPPSDNEFLELKTRAIELWREVGTDKSYIDEKIGRIRDITNFEDNFMYIVGMFDIHNQKKLAEKLTMKTRKAVRQRMIDGGVREDYIVF